MATQTPGAAVSRKLFKLLHFIPVGSRQVKLLSPNIIKEKEVEKCHLSWPNTANPQGFHYRAVFVRKPSSLAGT